MVNDKTKHFNIGIAQLLFNTTDRAGYILSYKIRKGSLEALQFFRFPVVVSLL